MISVRQFFWFESQTMAGTENFVVWSSHTSDYVHHASFSIFSAILKDSSVWFWKFWLIRIWIVFNLVLDMISKLLRVGIWKGKERLSDELGQRTILLIGKGGEILSLFSRKLHKIPNVQVTGPVENWIWLPRIGKLLGRTVLDHQVSWSLYYLQLLVNFFLLESWILYRWKTWKRSKKESGGKHRR